MPADYILLIENPAEIAIDLGRIRIRRIGFPDAFIAVEDIGILVLHHHTIVLTVHALRCLASAGAVVMITDELHHPSALMLPVAANRAAPSRLRRQIAQLDGSLSATLWQNLVQSRIRTQSATLRALTLHGAMRLERMISEVTVGDATHREGQAAKHYWQHLFDDFLREKEGAIDPINSRLNYGYAVLRSLVARELVSAGLSCELGLGHKSIENPFNLADDFMEPYRFTVERHVHQLNANQTLDSAGKKDILRFIESEVQMNKKSYRLLPAVRETVASYVRILDKATGKLILPVG